MEYQYNPVSERAAKDAISAQGGACNPVALANSFIGHAVPLLHEKGTDAVRHDPALRLIVHQLAFLMGTYAIDSDLDLYGKLTEKCKDF